MQLSQTTDVIKSLIEPFNYQHKLKDYVIIVLLSIIGIIGTISCLTGDQNASKTYTIQDVTFARY
jgi:hypothetical protein